MISGKVNMMGCIKQMNRIPNFFLVLYLLYAILNCHEEEQHFSYWWTQSTFQLNFYGHVTAAGHLNMHLMFHCTFRTDWIIAKRFHYRHIFFYGAQLLEVSCGDLSLSIHLLWHWVRMMYSLLASSPKWK